MAKGNKIVVSSNPKGVFQDVIISGTPKPGTVMQIKAATEPVEGMFTMEVFNQAGDGTHAETAVLVEDDKQGKTATQAYVDGTVGQVYFPAHGEELNMLFQNQSGTADDIAIGDRFEVDDGTGLMIAEATGTAKFKALETVTDPTADQLVWMKYLG